jgi:signal transduction histidine kinase
VLPLVARWTTWLLGVGVMLFGGGSASTRALAPIVLSLTLGALLVGSFVLIRLFGSGWPRRRGVIALVAGLDVAFSLLILWLEGGWTAAFYEVAMTTVVLPAFVFGWSGALVSSAAFSAGHAVILLTSPDRPPGESLEFQVAALLNPWIVAGFVAVLARLLQRLEAVTARNLELAAREERWRIAREIHDGVAQQAYILALGLETAVELANRDDLAGLQQRLPSLEKLSRQALLEVRQYVAEARPLMLGERSLTTALAGLAREFSTVTRVPVELVLPEEAPELPSVVESALYRIAQESLSNVFKHATARQAWLTLSLDADRLALEVADDGVGVDPERASRGFGLEGMRRRVADRGGSLEIGPRPGGGACVRVTLPRKPRRGGSGR